jgi:hypothetical protein
MSKTHVIDGVTYVEVDRDAKVGDKAVGKYTGRIYDVSEVTETGHIYDVFGFNSNRASYYVLEECCEEAPDITDLLANLARRVTSLERQLSDTQANVEKLAEELADVKYNAKKHIERLTCDIITLDERLNSTANKRIEVIIHGE